jgi:hypothetical protein
MKTPTLSKIIITVLVLIACGDGALWIYARHHTIATIKSTINEHTFAQVPDALIRKHLVAQANAPLQQLTTTIAGESESTTAAYDLPHAKTRLTTVANNKLTSEMIITGIVYHVRDFTDGKWWTQAVTHATKNQQLIVSSTDYAKDLQQPPHASFTAQGQETCGQLRCYKYRQTDKTSDMTLWFDTKNLLLQKTQATSQGTSVTVQYSYSQFSIATPSHTKPVPQGKSIFDYAFAESLPTTDEHDDQANPEDQQQLQQLQEELRVKDPTQ